jgi:hypothetical protein
MLCGCDNVYTWKEQVELHDGRIIVIERTDVYDPAWGNPEAGPRGKFKESRLRFMEPVAAEWRSEIPPIAVDAQNASAYIVIALRGGGQCERYGNPNPPFVYFRFTRDRGWERIAQQAVPIQIKQNLLIAPLREAGGQEGPVSPSRKRQLNVLIDPTILNFDSKNLSRQKLC